MNALSDSDNPSLPGGRNGHWGMNSKKYARNSFPL